MAAGVALLAAACARGGLVLELTGSIMYDKPRIESIAHTLNDARTDGGPVSVTIVMVGDPGLKASFDISPGIAERQQMTEKVAGHYEAEFVFPKNTVGGRSASSDAWPTRRPARSSSGTRSRSPSPSPSTERNFPDRPEAPDSPAGGREPVAPQRTRERSRGDDG